MEYSDILISDFQTLHESSHFMLERAKKLTQKLSFSPRESIVLCIYSALLTLALILGYSSINPSLGWGALIALIPALFVALSALVFLAYSVLRSREGASRVFGFHSVPRRKFWLIPFLLLSALWIASWFIFWPGTYTSDTTDCIAQALGVKHLSSHHPICFTLLMAPFMNIANLFGNLEYGMAAFSLFQAIFLALVCSYLAFWIKCRTNSTVAFLGTAAFFLLNPVVGQYALSAWKDVWFSGFLLLFCLRLFDCALSTSLGRTIQKGTFIQLALFGLGAMLFRNNGSIIILLTLILACIAFKPVRKQITVLGASILVAFLLITGPVFSLLNPYSSSFVETVGIPIQQLAKAIINDGDFSEEAKEYLDRLMDEEEVRSVFDPHLVDPVKWSKNFDDTLLNEDKGQFLLVWAESAPANLKSYFTAWRDITLGYWFVGTKDWIVAAPGYETIPRLESSEQVKWPEERNPHAKSIIDVPFISPSSIRAQISVLRDTPLIGLVFNLAFLAWTAIGVCAYLFCRKTNRFIVAVCPLLLLWLTLLVAAPTFCQFRYMFAFELALPMLVALLTFSMPSLKHAKPHKPVKSNHH